MERETSRSLRAILEGDVHPGPVGDDLVLVDRHIQFYDFRDSQVFEGLPGGLHRVFRGFLPRRRARSHDIDHFVHAVHRSSPFRTDFALLGATIVMVPRSPFPQGGNYVYCMQIWRSRTEMNWYNSIGMKIILSVVGMILIVNGTLAWLFLGIQRDNLNHTILRTASQLSETIKKSIQNDMLQNRKEAAYKVMETIGRQEGIEKVRVYSSEGKILFSSDNTGEVGRMVNQRAEACYGCHSEA